MRAGNEASGGLNWNKTSRTLGMRLVKTLEQG